MHEGVGIQHRGSETGWTAVVSNAMVSAKSNVCSTPDIRCRYNLQQLRSQAMFDRHHIPSCYDAGSCGTGHALDSDIVQKCHVFYAVSFEAGGSRLSAIHTHSLSKPDAQYQICLAAS